MGEWYLFIALGLVFTCGMFDDFMVIDLGLDVVAVGLIAWWSVGFDSCFVFSFMWLRFGFGWLLSLIVVYVCRIADWLVMPPRLCILCL